MRWLSPTTLLSLLVFVQVNNSMNFFLPMASIFVRGWTEINCALG